ncbi:hypothetical protein CIPAW_06G117400 [Carya illinoinensis]|uniref:Uncharacterized protein n=1 Tax=Carya illinoinensis TaxID=32201 RepID=A0A8T1QAJ8_CARIL|nr:hypothetical protein CIPAW_06G117400 [Carya illinoinensis]
MESIWSQMSQNEICCFYYCHYLRSKMDNNNSSNNNSSIQTFPATSSKKKQKTKNKESQRQKVNSNLFNTRLLEEKPFFQKKNPFLSLISTEITVEEANSFQVQHQIIML